MLFREHISALVASIVSAAGRESAPDVRRDAHSLLGMGGTIGVPSLSVVAEDLSSCAKQGDYRGCLAFGDCTLLAHSAYDLRYSVKKERIGDYLTADMPDPAFMVEGFRRAVGYKEWGDFQTLEPEAWREEFERIRCYYIRFFNWYEARRLATEVSSLDGYLTALADSGRDCSVGKAILLNARLFGRRALEYRGRLLGLHPRARLYLALPRLLGDAFPAEELQRLLALGSAQRDALESEFYRLQKRLS